jgi:hypothetical protein
MLLLALCEQRRLPPRARDDRLSGEQQLVATCWGVGWPGMANVLYERVGAASLLTIDRPERRNAIDGQTAEELLAGLPQL